jgi:transmembrane sensor
MSHPEDKRSLEEEARCEQAVEWFLRMRSESARLEDLPDLQRWIEADPLNALAYRQASATWTTLDDVASSPAIVVGRRDALEDAHQARQQRGASRSSDASKASARRQMSLAAIAASAVLVLALCVWFLTGPQWHSYSTNIGERRTVTLPDGSVMTLDARSRVRFKYTDKERRISFEQGQARFAVAKDPARPFHVLALDRTVVALGTNFNVEVVSNILTVTLIEGRVAVIGLAPAVAGDSTLAGVKNTKAGSPAPSPGSVTARGRKQNESHGAGVIELAAGEGLRVRQDGRAVLVPNIDPERATAWQAGKVFFDNEPLGSAAERVNRYARRPIRVDPSIATLGISGVFNSEDPDAFVEAVTAYFPVQVEATDTAEIHLIPRH